MYTGDSKLVYGIPEITQWKCSTRYSLTSLPGRSVFHLFLPTLIKGKWIVSFPTFLSVPCYLWEVISYQLERCCLFCVWIWSSGSKGRRRLRAASVLAHCWLTDALGSASPTSPTCFGVLFSRDTEKATCKRGRKGRWTRALLCSPPLFPCPGRPQAAHTPEDGRANQEWMDPCMVGLYVAAEGTPNGQPCLVGSQ